MHDEQLALYLDNLSCTEISFTMFISAYVIEMELGSKSVA